MARLAVKVVPYKFDVFTVARRAEVLSENQQREVNDGWTIRAQFEQDGYVYVTYVRKEHGC
jgi:hypothetical protein